MFAGERASIALVNGALWPRSAASAAGWNSRRAYGVRVHAAVTRQAFQSASKLARSISQVLQSSSSHRQATVDRPP